MTVKPPIGPFVNAPSPVAVNESLVFTAASGQNAAQFLDGDVLFGDNDLADDYSLRDLSNRWKEHDRRWSMQGLIRLWELNDTPELQFARVNGIYSSRTLARRLLTAPVTFPIAKLAIGDTSAFAYGAQVTTTLTSPVTLAANLVLGTVTGVPTAGAVVVDPGGSNQVVSYNGYDSATKTLQNCTGGAGTFPVGTVVCTQRAVHAIVQLSGGGGATLVSYDCRTATEICHSGGAGSMGGTGTFSVGDIVWDAQEDGTALGLSYGSPWQGEGGLQQRAAQISYKLAGTANPNGAGLYNAPGQLWFSTTAAGYGGARQDRAVIDERGRFAWLGGGLAGSTDTTRRVTFAGPGARLNASTKLVGSHSLPTGTLNVRTTAQLLTAGKVLVNGAHTVTYTGKTSTTLTGCTGGTGVMPNESSVNQKWDTVTASGVTLYVDDVTQWTETSGTLFINDFTVTYSGIDTTNVAFTGCAFTAATFNGDNYVRAHDSLHQTVVVGILGQLIASDGDATARTTIGNVLSAKGGIQVGTAGAGPVRWYRNQADEWKTDGKAICALGVGTQHVAGATPTGGTSGEVKVGTGKIWVNDAGTWKSGAVA